MNPSGVMHGGASFGLADTAVAHAGHNLRPRLRTLTIEMKINYLEPIVSGIVTAEASVLRSSRRSAYAEVDVWASGKLAARATTTCTTAPAPPDIGGADTSTAVQHNDLAGQRALVTRRDVRHRPRDRAPAGSDGAEVTVHGRDAGRGAETVQAITTAGGVARAPSAPTWATPPTSGGSPGRPAMSTS